MPLFARNSVLLNDFVNNTPVRADGNMGCVQGIWPARLGDYLPAIVFAPLLARSAQNV